MKKFVVTTILLVVGSHWPTFAWANTLPKKFIVKYADSEKIIRLNYDPRKLQESTNGIIAASSTSSSIEYVEEDIVLSRFVIPGEETGELDSYYYSQWALGNSGAAIRAPQAWDVTTGNSSVVVAVVDTGITDHSDINSKIVSGYDFISDSDMARDGSGRDSDPTDAGDYVSSTDSCYQGSFESSSWHGTHVAGIIAASTGNAKGVAGVSWGAKIQPVRVLGKCGGYTSDIADAIRWAAGGNVSGVVTNATPAKVINLSLGGSGSCPQYLQSAIDDARSRGAVVVVAAGNSALNLDYNDVTPANCNGVIRVASSGSGGTLSSFSNYGRNVDIMAPGENIYSLGNSGTTTSTSESYTSYSGTSMAAPYVSGVIALMMSVNDTLYPNQYKAIMKEVANTSAYCGSKECGAGIVDAYEAVLLAQDTIADQNTGDDTTVVRDPISSESQVVTKSSGGGFCGSVTYNKDDNFPWSFAILIMGAIYFTRKRLGRI